METRGVISCCVEIILKNKDPSGSLKNYVSIFTRVDPKEPQVDLALEHNFTKLL